MPITRKAIESSNISSVGWEGKELEVEFKSGAVYIYDNVPERVYLEFISASSAGKYFNKYIKDNYEYTQI